MLQNGKFRILTDKCAVIHKVQCHFANVLASGMYMPGKCNTEERRPKRGKLMANQVSNLTSLQGNSQASLTMLGRELSCAPSRAHMGLLCWLVAASCFQVKNVVACRLWLQDEAADSGRVARGKENFPHGNSC